MSDHDSGNARRGRASFGAFVRKPVERGAPVGAAAEQGGLDAVQALPDDAVEVGAVVDAYGLKGWVKVATHADAGRGGDALLSARRWWLEKGTQRFSARIVQSKTHGDTVVAQPAGVGDRDAALALRGFRVFVRREDFPALAADEFYWVDLIGLDVVNEQSATLGKVVGMIDNGAHSIMRVEYPSVGKDGRPAAAERLIPFVGVYVKTVDQAARRIVVDWEADY
ncbi:ribosome maturation factor RimM [Burkholderia multivorans]|uniref:ribosome maturation factor RimM n=1 Tax=Burkholderia multivorans TaxID=87883 RepID=UPI00057D2F0D|nr:ribosome maturation factor RimM [Burkholderia multivorans]KHS12285.1 16S rRNA processing protein RimM [Burkholderia multivorans]KHS12977.1 16S rRNA processing protein RimM [Burkholderia multivorans]MBR8104538.1 ribosome maturation factor RimM [Burkholderia multivorans]MBR8339169.1 ribosome maturation factor RimM [Burkholderia multivorans]MBU9430352.1 ribosome maturation factor RimM [Burkholderia multivorans]